MIQQFFTGTAFICLLIAVILSVTVSARLYSYATIANQARDFRNIIIETPSIGSFVVRSYEPETRILQTDVYYRPAMQLNQVQFRLSEDFYLERQDVIFENGVIVGITPITRVPESELKPGVRGYGRIRAAEDGRFELMSAVIGDPYPRP